MNELADRGTKLSLIVKITLQCALVRYAAVASCKHVGVQILRKFVYDSS